MFVVRPFFHINMKGSTQKLLEAFVNQPTTYTVDVLDNSMLPKSMQAREQLKFTVKRPTLKVLALMALPLSRIPKEVRENPTLTVQEATKYSREMAESIATMAHGASGREMPEWYPEFFLANLTDTELYEMFKEVALKTDNSFFLTYTQTANLTNPMIIENSIPTN